MSEIERKFLVRQLPGDLGVREPIDHGAPDGRCVVEVEFDDRDGARDFVPPDWFGEEITDDPDWSNAALAQSSSL